MILHHSLVSQPGPDPGGSTGGATDWPWQMYGWTLNQQPWSNGWIDILNFTDMKLEKLWCFLVVAVLCFWFSNVHFGCPLSKTERPKDRETANEWLIVHISPPTSGAHYPSEFVWQYFVVLIQKKSFCTRDVIRLMDHVSFQPSHRHRQKPTRWMPAEVCVLAQGKGIEDMIFKTLRH